MKRLILFIFVYGLLIAKDRVYVIYGTQPEKALSVRYIDNQKKGFFKQILKEGFTVKETENIPLGEGFYLHEASVSALNTQEKIIFKVGLLEKTFSTCFLKNDNFTFCVAGDIFREFAPFVEGTKALAKLNPDFVVFGGDLAYSTHGPSNDPLKRHLKFIEVLSENLVNASGDLIPLVIALGNHDYKKDHDTLAPVLYFPPYSKSYRLYEMKGLDLFILDTGHMESIEGLQLNFLKKHLEDSKNALKLAVYHMGAYPAYYDFESSIPQHLRSSFVPLFDQYGMLGAFEHHSHCFKVTKKIKNNTLDETGCRYFGDGCFGVKPREPKNKEAWYIEQASADHNFYRVEKMSNSIKVTAYDFNLKQRFESWQLQAQTQAMSAQ